MTTSRNINPENWAVLSDSVKELLWVPGNQTDFTWRVINTFRNGLPGDYLPYVAAKAKQCLARSYNATERARAASLLETLVNYGLIASVEA
jgi:hypothetical protein